jgi:hypothetical protein
MVSKGVAMVDARRYFASHRSQRDLRVTLGWDKAKIPWDFLSDQVLGMKWLNYLLGLAITGIGGTFAGGFLAIPRRKFGSILHL